MIKRNIEKINRHNMKRAIALTAACALIFTGCGATANKANEPATEPKVSAPATENAQVSAPAVESAANTAAFVENEGTYEAFHAVMSGITPSDITAVSYAGDSQGAFGEDELKYLVRENADGNVRIDVPGVAPGKYTLTVTAGDDIYTGEEVVVKAYDRSGYAHFEYTDGVGAYKDDGTAKDNAIILYVTDENKNDVELTYKDLTVKGIGNILNSGGMAAEPDESASENDVPRTSKGGLANTNGGILKMLADDNIPLIVRFIGVVSESGLYERGEWDPKDEGLIDGLTAFSLEKELTEEKGLEPVFDYGANQGDNGHMARMVSAKDVTLEGVGDNAVIDGWGFHFIASGSDKDTDRGHSFEMRNLTFINTAEDAVGMEGNTEKNEEGKDDISLPFTQGVERCWIHNNEFYRPSLSDCAAAEGDKMEGDGSIDFKKGQYATFSYNYFEGCHKTSLIGGNDNAIQFNVTYHHNHWKDCESRAPLSRNANIHMYDNYFEGQTGYCMNVRATGYIFSEYNIFDKCRNPYWIKDETGAIKSYKDRLTDEYYEDMEDAYPVTVVEDKSEEVPNECRYIAGGVDYGHFDTDSTVSYIPDGNYQLEEDYDAVLSAIDNGCGVH